MTNVEIKSVLTNNKNDNFYDIYLKIKAGKDNFIFVNFHLYKYDNLWNRLIILKS